MRGPHSRTRSTTTLPPAATYAYVLTYLVVVTTWVATALALLSPWIVRWIAAPAFEESSRVVGPLAFSTVAFAGYLVVAIGVGRARRTQFNWVVTGAAAVVNIALNLLLIPPYGMMGAAIATIAAYTTMFAGMAWWPSASTRSRTSGAAS